MYAPRTPPCTLHIANHVEPHHGGGLPKLARGLKCNGLLPDIPLVAVDEVRGR